MIKNVVFDAGNVLVDFCWRELMQDLGFSEEVQKTFEKTVFGNSLWNELDRGVIEESEVVEMMRAENSGHCKEFDMVWANRDKLVKPFDYALSIVEELKARGLRVYLLSNYPRELFDMHEKMGRFPYIGKLDGRVVSGFVKLVKPDREIYEHLLDTYGLKAEECVFIDDRKENVEAAEALGFKGIWFLNYGQMRGELEKLI